MEKIIVVDIDKCMGCHSCALSCAVAHSKSKDLVKAINEKDKPYPKIIIDQIEGKPLPIHCRHCEDAPCVVVCPTGSVSKPTKESPVVLNNDKCIGCHACIIACPFGVIRKGPDGKSLIKCDLCIERLKENGEPACVIACPTKAIKFITVEELNLKKHKEDIEKYKVIMKQG